MIYTVTFNPSLDYVVSVREMKLGRTNRADREQLLPGGKGINVSTVLSHLGIPNRALGFIAGWTGEALAQQLEQLGVVTDFIRLRTGMTRINLKLRSIDGTEINGRGPVIGEAEREALLEKLAALREGDVLVLAGSIPPSMGPDTYGRVMEMMAGRKIRTVVDAEGELLFNVLRYHPFLIKPNQHELGALFGRELDTVEAVIPCARQLQTMGAANVLVSMGGDGAVLAAESGHLYRSGAPKGQLVNSVGAGDSMVAGFLAGWLSSDGRDEAYAFRMGIAAGSASAFSENLAGRSEIEAVLEQMTRENMLAAAADDAQRTDAQEVNV